jgi:hypothetical protein
VRDWHELIRFVDIPTWLLVLLNGVPARVFLIESEGTVAPIAQSCVQRVGERRLMSCASTCRSLGSLYFGIVAASDFYHTHPHLQRVKSLNRSFFNSSLQTAHDLIHIVLILDTSYQSPREVRLLGS